MTTDFDFYRKLLVLFLLMFMAVGAFADRTRTCYAKISYDLDFPYSGASVELSDFEAQATKSTANKARKAARDKIIKCSNAIWENRFPIDRGEMGSPPECAILSGNPMIKKDFSFGEHQLKHRLAVLACTSWSPWLDVTVGKVTLSVYGDDECDAKKTYSDAYTVSTNMCFGRGVDPYF